MRKQNPNFNEQFSIIFFSLHSLSLFLSPFFSFFWCYYFSLFEFSSSIWEKDAISDRHGLIHSEPWAKSSKHLIMAECLHRIDCIDATTITIIKIDRRLFMVTKNVYVYIFVLPGESTAFKWRQPKLSWHFEWSILMMQMMMMMMIIIILWIKVKILHAHVTRL